MSNIELTPIQLQIINGEICPYCKGKAQLINADEIYCEKGLGEVMICRPCQAWVGVHKSGPNAGRAKGRLAKASLRSLKTRIHAEFDRLWSTNEERKEAYTGLSEHLGLPREFTHIGMFSEKTMGKVLEFCMMNADRTGANLKWTRLDADCPEKTSLKSGSSACRGCPCYVMDDQTYVWCDTDLSYGRLKE